MIFLGIVLLSLPVLIAIGFMIREVGLGTTMMALGIVAAIVASCFLGTLCLTEGLK